MAIKLSITASWAKRVLADSDRKMVSSLRVVMV